MLNKKYRFHSRGGVRFVYKNGKTIRRGKASLVVCENARGFTRIAVVVSKKVMKTAVGRNRIRRRVYEILRKNFELVPKGRDYIFVIFSKEVMEMPNVELEKLLGELFEESKIV